MYLQVLCHSLDKQKVIKQFTGAKLENCDVFAILDYRTVWGLIQFLPKERVMKGQNGSWDWLHFSMAKWDLITGDWDFVTRNGRPRILGANGFALSEVMRYDFCTKFLISNISCSLQCVPGHCQARVGIFLANILFFNLKATFLRLIRLH